MMPGMQAWEVDLERQRDAVVERQKLALALTALRRIRSLEAKNVPKYAQAMASEALDLIEGKG